MNRYVTRRISACLTLLALALVTSVAQADPDHADNPPRMAAPRGSSGRRARRVAIVAVARKLVLALWRMATLGIVPEGAMLRPAAAAS